MLIFDLNMKLSGPTRPMSSERRLTKSLIPLTIIGGVDVVFLPVEWAFQSSLHLNLDLV